MGVQNECPKWVSKMGVQNGCPKWMSKMGVQKVQKKSSKKVAKKSSKKVQKKVRKIIIKNYKLLEGRGGWRIVIPMPDAINFVDGRRQKSNSSNVKQLSV
jgi:hypothetical protein